MIPPLPRGLRYVSLTAMLAGKVWVYHVLDAQGNIWRLNPNEDDEWTQITQEQTQPGGFEGLAQANMPLTREQEQAFIDQQKAPSAR